MHFEPTRSGHRAGREAPECAVVTDGLDRLFFLRCFGLGRRKPLRALRRIVIGRPILNASLAAVLSLFFATGAPAQSPLAQCFMAAAERYHLSPVLLYSIAWHESRLNPLTMNLNGDGTTDIGIMQVNARWLPALAILGITRNMLFDPCTNISVGAWVLANEFYRNGASWAAVGRYNSRDRAIGAHYAVRIRGVFNSVMLTALPAKEEPVN